MRVTQFNRPWRQWTCARPTIHRSGHDAGYRKGCPATTGTHTRATVHTTCHGNCVATFLTIPTSFRRAGSTLSAKPNTSTIPITISEDATVAKVAQLLRAHREEIEASSRSARRRREIASATNVGLQALTWVKQLDGLDDQHLIPKDFCTDLGWLLVAEGNDQLAISWYLEESFRLVSTMDYVRPNKITYHGSDVYGCRVRRRHDLLVSLIAGHIALSLDGTPVDAIRCLGALINDSIRLGVGKALLLAGAVTALQRAVMNDRVPPYPSSLFDEFIAFNTMSGTLTHAANDITNAKMYHPVAPNPWPMFLQMEQVMADNYRWRHKINRKHWNKAGLT
jgi:hypothetical protein